MYRVLTRATRVGLTVCGLQPCGMQHMFARQYRFGGLLRLREIKLLGQFN